MAVLRRNILTHRASAARISAIRKSAARTRRRIPIFLRSAGSSGRGGSRHPERSRLISILLGAATANGTRFVALTTRSRLKADHTSSGWSAPTHLLPGLIVKVLRKRLSHFAKFQQRLPNDLVRRQHVVEPLGDGPDFLAKGSTAYRTRAN